MKNEEKLGIGSPGTHGGSSGTHGPGIREVSVINATVKIIFASHNSFFVPYVYSDHLVEFYMIFMFFLKISTFFVFFETQKMRKMHFFENFRSTLKNLVSLFFSRFG